MGEKEQVTAAAATKTHDSHFALSVQVINARVTYRNAPIHLLEKFTFKDVEGAHKAFVVKAGVDECVILQTCNRVEVFAAAKRATDEAKLLAQWAEAAGLEKKDLASVEVSTGKDAVMHLMKLASGLDSLVVGEDQILGQVRRAFEFSRANHYASANLAVIFDRALKVGSRVRTATGINKGNVSIASVAVNLADEYFDDIKAKKVMLIGSGEAASLVAKVLKNSGVDFMITSRTYERARSFSETAAGRPVPFDAALSMLGQLDLIFVASAAPYFLITYEKMQEAARGRKDAVMIFDLSNPRTVDEKVATIHGVKLINMDQIAELAEKNMRSRMKEAHAAEKMIEGEMKSVDGMMKRMKAEPVVVSVFKSVDAIRERELKKALSMLGKNKADSGNSYDAKVVEQLSYAIVEGILSTPMNYLRKEIEEGGIEGEELMKMVSKMFKYEDEKKQQ